MENILTYFWENFCIYIFIFKYKADTSSAPRWYTSLDQLNKNKLIRSLQNKKKSEFIKQCKMEFQISKEQVNQFLCWWNLDENNSNMVRRLQFFYLFISRIPVNCPLPSDQNFGKIRGWGQLNLLPFFL